MAGVEKISVPKLGGDNWSIWKAKFQALLEYKGLFVAIEEPETEDGKKASKQAKALLTLHIEDAFVKLIVGEPTAAKAWDKLKQNFEKTSNARVVQLTGMLANMKMGEKQSIAQYLGEFREIKVDLEGAGETVSELQLAVHALRGLPKGYETLKEILEAGELQLSLDNVQPKLMQREQTLKLQAESKTLPAENAEESQGTAFVAKQRYLGSSREHRGSSDARSCFGCGETGHIKAHCRHRDAECENCGKRGHTRAVCRKPAERVERAAYAKAGAGVAFTAWRGGAGALPGVWLVDSGSTQHVTGDRSQFTSYRKLGLAEVIEGIGGEPLTAVGVGTVELQCSTPNGAGSVTLKEVRHVPEARANLFALRRATDAGARIVIEGRTALFEMGGAVCMKAQERDGLWEIATAAGRTDSKTGEKGAILETVREAKKEPARARVWVFDETPRYPMNGTGKAPVAQKAAQAESVKEKVTEVVEIDLDSDEDGEEPQAGKAKTGAAEKSGRAGNTKKNKEKAAAAEGVAKVTVEEIDIRGSSESDESPEKRRYPERARKPTSWLEAAKGPDKTKKV